MPRRSSGLSIIAAGAPRSPTAETCLAHAHGQALAVLAEMQRHGIMPTPRNYELWLAYRAGEDPALSRRMASLLDSGQELTPALLGRVYKECIAEAAPGEADLAEADLGADMEALGTTSARLQEAAQSLVEQVAGGQAAMQDYGKALAGCAVRLGQDLTPDGLAQAIAMLTAETAQATERNRKLERQLAASTAQISKLRQNLADQKQAASTDALTGLLNRRAFDARLRPGMAQLRAKPDTALSLLLADIDHFKRFNDTYGHRTGDLVLRLVGRLLKESVTENDTVARYGGEEFAVILAGADLHAASVVARRIGAALGSKRMQLTSTPQGWSHITVSIGVAQGRPGESMAALVARADAALYEAKRTGRNRICVEQAPGAA